MLTANWRRTDARYPTLHLSSKPQEVELSDSGLTLSWLTEKLWQTSPEFRQAIVNGNVLQVTFTVSHESILGLD